MYLLYVDDAGSIPNKSERHFVLAGIAVFERQVYHLDLLLNDLARSIVAEEARTLEFHANEMQSGRNRWRRLGSKETRRAYLCDALRCADGLKGEWALFGIVVEKEAMPHEDVMEYCFEQLCNRFDHFLRRMHRRRNTQRGIIIMDESTKETRLQELALNFRTHGHRWGKPRNLVDVPFFVDSKATRLVQYADMVAYALWRAYEHQDHQFLDVIAHRFDRAGRAMHGLHIVSLENELVEGAIDL
ncbi:DUF3800 domain-containing protein [Peteryoungia ipomoeae]|uniref:DUF3800 domain-containing protein n=1 Tax=Peteryoungia ipomoeae TaxID=1210932 RepID=A0A4S8P5Z1_9HYPH|nr:DUF3800 domain-containing protein [Peteryoungia ipomoeae]THV23234.1 DUF3800 domain-containing protein [Peteryoungia ipomoeae]